MISIKGSCVFFDFRFYVVVRSNDKGIYCICDYANNSYYWEFDILLKDKNLLILPPDCAVRIHTYNNAISLLNEKEYEIWENTAKERGIPIEVICEVLVGIHDNRWNK